MTLCVRLRCASQKAVLRSLPATARARQVASLPQIPGTIFTNAEIADDSLVARIRQWSQASPSLSAGSFDMLQIAEVKEGKAAPRVVCGLMRTQLRFAGTEEPVHAFVALFYRSRDYLNREFWDDQVKRLCDVLADEYLTGKRGVQLTIHHDAPEMALGLEIGDHRLLGQLGALHIVGGTRAPSVEPEFIHSDESALTDTLVQSGHNDFHELQLAGLGDELPGIAGVSRGRYVVRGQDGVAICGIAVVGSLSWRLVLGGAWVTEGQDDVLTGLIEALRQKSRQFACTIIADMRDRDFQRLCKAGAPGGMPTPLGIWRSHGRLGIVVTSVPFWPSTR